jgi:hypothetical protein
MHRKLISKPVQVAHQTVAALNAMMKDTPYFFSRTDKGNLQFFRRYSYPQNVGHTCPRAEVENYMHFVMKLPLQDAIDRTFTALASGPITAQA